MDFFSRRYKSWWVLACFTISFPILLSLHFSLQFLTFIFFKSSSTSSSHLNLGLPTALDEHGSHSVNFSTVLVVTILITCAAQRNLRAGMDGCGKFSPPLGLDHLNLQLVAIGL